MIEDQITAYIEEKVKAVYPGLDENEVLVTAARGDAEYDHDFSQNNICSERLLYEIRIATDKPLNRLACLKAFRRGGVEDFLPDAVWQEYKRFERHNYQEASHLNVVSFFIEYLYDVKEEDQ